MLSLNVREARMQISRLLDRVAQGEVVTIMRRGRPAARLVRPHPDETPRFPDRQALRASVPPMRESAADTVRALRDAERY